MSSPQYHLRGNHPWLGISEDRSANISTLSSIYGAVGESGQFLELAAQRRMPLEEHITAHQEPCAVTSPFDRPLPLWSIHHGQRYYAQDGHLGMGNLSIFGDSIESATHLDMVLEDVPPIMWPELTVEVPPTALITKEVPQEPYVLKSQAPRTKQPTTRFVVDGRDGILMADALKGNFVGLDRKDSPAFPKLDCGKPSLRINLTGHERYSKQRNFCNAKHKRPTTVAELAYMVAEEVKCILEIKGKDPRWMLDSEAITLENLLLTEVEHVSHGSLQPKFLMVIHAGG